MKTVYGVMAELLERGESFAVVTVLEKKGSAPRGEGAKMAVRADGSTFGTVGGGGLEAEAARLALEAIRLRRASVHPYDLDRDGTGRAAMICGGAGRMFVDFIDAASEVERRIFLEAASLLEGGGRAWLVTDLGGSAAGPAPSGRRCLLRADGGRIGEVSCDPAAAEMLIRGPARRAFHPFLFGGDRFLAEPICRRGTVRIFGSGHVGRKTAPLCAAVGFHTVVYDDRSGSLDGESFPDPIETVAVGSFRDLPPLCLDDDSYVVIVTRGHLHDRDVLERALRGGAGYIGMIGSRRKKEALFRDLLDLGFSEGDLARVHTPIGLQIGAETPEEIAVSIVGELIASRADREKGWKAALAELSSS